MKSFFKYLAATLFLAVVAAFALQAVRTARRAAAVSANMATLVPPGALLSIESPDFAALLAQWNSSPEQKSWLTSANYSVFQNSRLFSRLADAETEFASTAFKADPPEAASFLTEIAGKQSIFAWYDVGNLEFLYITHLSPAQAARTSLLRARPSFSQRQSAGLTFYVRTRKAESATRTVAFAQVPTPAGDLLLLATREDLLANALALIANPEARAAGAGKSDSLANEPWFAEASAALPASASAPPALHMVLNLDRIVPLPYFRSYWVQRNVTEMAQYRSAVSDLYLDRSTLREERALLLKTPEDDPTATTAKALPLSTLAALPSAPGVFSANLTSDPDYAITALGEKLLGRSTAAAVAETSAPDPSLDTPTSGSALAAANDLETRIDTAPPAPLSASDEALTQLLRTAGLDAVLTVSSAGLPPTPTGLWIPIHSAVVLRATSPFAPPAVAAALQQSLRGTLTTGTLGIDFRPIPNTPAAFALSGPQPLFFAAVTTPTQGNLLLLANDQPLLLALLKSTAQPASATPPTTSPETYIAAFNHTSQRPPYARLTSLIDGTNTTPTATAAGSPKPPAPPQFFSGNLRSLSDALAPLASERIVEHQTPTARRQTVTYQWQTP